MVKVTQKAVTTTTVAAKSIGYHSVQLLYGIFDGCRIDKPIQLLLATPSRSVEKDDQHFLRSRLIKNLKVNGAILLGSAALFEFAALPLITSLCTPFSWVPLIADIGFEVLWFVPAYGICFIVSNSIYNDIANIYSISNKGYHLAHSGLVETPYEKIHEKVYRYGMVLSFLSSSFVTSFYANEYRWKQKGLELQHQSKIMDNNYAYFIGQGALLTALSFFCPPTIGMSIMLVGFPFLLLNAHHKNYEQRQEMFERVKPRKLYFSNLPLLKSAEQLSYLIFGLSAKLIQKTYAWLNQLQQTKNSRLALEHSMMLENKPIKAIEPPIEFREEVKTPMLFMGPRINNQFPLEKIVEEPVEILPRKWIKNKS